MGQVFFSSSLILSNNLAIINRLREPFSVVSNFEMFNQLNTLRNLSKEDIFVFFKEIKGLKNLVSRQGWETVSSDKPKNKLIAQVFFESSTRTRISFEFAAQRLNLKLSHFQMDDSTSLSKGETIEDSLKVVEALNPDLIIYRSKQSDGLEKFFSETKIPFVCAGYGTDYHPSQALLDMYTLFEFYGEKISDLKMLFVGDTKFSRVVGSHLELSKILGYSIKQCSDDDHSRDTIENVRDLSKAVVTSDVIMRLRTQTERGSKKIDSRLMVKAAHLNAEVLLMHPGPFIRGEDFEYELPEHPKSLIWKQKENGLYVRAMILKKIWSDL